MTLRGTAARPSASIVHAAIAGATNAPVTRTTAQAVANPTPGRLAIGLESAGPTLTPQDLWLAAWEDLSTESIISFGVRRRY